jgi:hypothetical protein
MRAEGGVADTGVTTRAEMTRTTRTAGGATAGNRRSALRSACSRGTQCASHAASFAGAACIIIAQSAGIPAACWAIALAGCIASEAIAQACARLMSWAETKPRIIKDASQRRERSKLELPSVFGR